MTEPGERPISEGVVWDTPRVARAARWTVLGQRGATVWITGLPASGKSTLAKALEARLVGDGRFAYRLDGDNLRHGLNGDLGFDPASRDENVRRASEVARLFSDAGAITIVSIVSPYAAARSAARSVHEREGLDFVEVWVSTPLEECEKRDPKGLYARARAGELTGMTGIDAPYEPPTTADLVYDAGVPTNDAVGGLLAELAHRGVIQD